MGKPILICIIEWIVNIYDLITLPLYYLFQQPWKVRQEALRKRAKQVDRFVWRSLDNSLDSDDVNKSKTAIDTLDKVFRESVRKYGPNNCLGHRKVLGVEYKDSGRKQVSKYLLDSEYEWFTYNTVEGYINSICESLREDYGEFLMNSDGLRKILICSDTCMGWFLLAQACFRLNITVVTAYTALDDDNIADTLRQTEAKVMAVSRSFLDRVPSLLRKEGVHIESVIVVDDLALDSQNKSNNKNKIRNAIDGLARPVASLGDILQRGLDQKAAPETDNSYVKPTGKDIAVIMYTSGSTGTAKGVMMSHQGLVHFVMSFCAAGELSDRDTYIGYLPLGHVFELAAECLFLYHGSKIAYSSPATLMSNSPMLKRGQVGDILLVKPTVMGAVPLVLDRIKNSLQSKFKSRGSLYDGLFNKFVIEYKRYWWDRYYDTPLLNLLICNRIKNNLFGGRLRVICSGGASLSRDTQEYVRHLTGVAAIQGYGLTETSAAASFSDMSERRFNVVGAPYPGISIKLDTWQDYCVYDQPYPRGEIVVGGDSVSAGYYKMPELTAEAFYEDPETKVRYFRTGDIGLMMPDGVLKIIDRKKDIVKPQSGEYICLGFIESVLVTCPYVENICVYCSQFSNYIVAIVRPNEFELRNLAKKLCEQRSDLREKLSLSADHQLSAKSDGDHSNWLDSVKFETLCNNDILNDHIHEALRRVGSKGKLKHTQIPSRIKLVASEWTVESGLITSSFKLRRRQIELVYKKDIRNLYEELGQDIEW